MKKLLLLLILISTPCFAGVNNIVEQDGSPSVYPWKIKVSNGTLTDNGDGSASLDNSGTATSGWTRTAPQVYLTNISDKVGIGTTAPGTGLLYGSGIATSLHAASSSSAAIAMQSTGGAALLYAEGVSNVILGLADSSATSNYRILDVLSSGGKMSFRRINDAYSAAQATGMTIDYVVGDHSGYVGIGTIAPGSVGAGERLTVLAPSGGTWAANFGTSDYAAGVGTGVLIGCGAASGNSYGAIQASNTGANANANLVLEPNGGNVGIGVVNPTSLLHVAQTFPTSVSAETIGANFLFTTAGSSNQIIVGLQDSLLAGYTGPSYTIASYVTNFAAGTGTGSWAVGAANYGTSGQTFGQTTGHNVGNSAAAAGSSTLNIAGLNTAYFNLNSPAINVGSASLALNATTNVGGFFGLMATAPTLTSAALIADNGAVSAPVALFRVNGTTQVSIDASGNLNVVGLTASQAVGTDGSKNLISISTPIIVGNDRKTAQTAAVSLATYTVGAADTSYQISANVNVTAFAVGTFNIQVAYTDETNTAQTLKLNFSSVTGTIGLAIAATGPFEGIPAHIRAKAGSTIIVSSTGTFTSLTYNLEERIVQL